MTTFSTVNRTPGVYVQEITLPGPIPGVGTSVVAFVGPARNGPINTPTLITSWSQFCEQFGGLNDREELYISSPVVYVTHAVRGFFDNGGSVCYFVRVSKQGGAKATYTFKDRAATPLDVLSVTARCEGARGNAIYLGVSDTSLMSGSVVRVQATLTSATGNQAKLPNATEAAKFVAGDVVVLEEPGTSGAAGKTERAKIATVSGDTITFTAILSNTFGATGTIRIADPATDQKTIRLDKTEGIERGTVLQFSQDTLSESQVVSSVEHPTRIVTLASPLKSAFKMAPSEKSIAVKSREFDLVVNYTTGGVIERFQYLSLHAEHSRYIEKVVSSAFVVLKILSNTTPLPEKHPAPTGGVPLASGSDDAFASVDANHYINAIGALRVVDEVSILCVPDAVGTTDMGRAKQIQLYAIAHCELMQDRFVILDTPSGLSTQGALTHRSQLSSGKGYAALYYPWIQVTNPVGSGLVLVPPSGHIAGTYVRSDATRGVHKAPANEPLRGAVGLERKLIAEDQGLLNEQGINVLRSFPGEGIVVWGARTLALGSSIWRYVNVRRLMLFIEESLQQGTRFAVFEPNDLALWQTLKRQVTEFLTRVWRDGALFGATPDQAFRVRIDEELNPTAQRALGQLVIEVVVYPVTPAEFIIFRVIQQPGGPLIKE